MSYTFNLGMYSYFPTSLKFDIQSEFCASSTRNRYRFQYNLSNSVTDQIHIHTFQISLRLGIHSYFWCSKCTKSTENIFMGSISKFIPISI